MAQAANVEKSDKEPNKEDEPKNEDKDENVEDSKVNDNELEPKKDKKKDDKKIEKLILSEKEWKKKLTAKEFRILRKKGTERAFTGEYDKFYPKKGYFVCGGCNNPLYSIDAKYNSGCGWPAFDMCYKDSIKTETDTSHGMVRIEIMCNKCDGHLGHVFTDGHSNRKVHGKNQTTQRHCVNSVSVKYIKDDPPLYLKETWLDLKEDVYKNAEGCILM